MTIEFLSILFTVGFFFFFFLWALQPVFSCQTKTFLRREKVQNEPLAPRPLLVFFFFFFFCLFFSSSPPICFNGEGTPWGMIIVKKKIFRFGPEKDQNKTEKKKIPEQTRSIVRTAQIHARGHAGAAQRLRCTARSTCKVFCTVHGICLPFLTIHVTEDGSTKQKARCWCMVCTQRVDSQPIHMGRRPAVVVYESFMRFARR